MSKGKNERIEELEKQVKKILWCLNWDFQRLQDLTDRVETLEAAEKVRTGAPSKVIVSEQPQCTRTHVCGTGDPCNGYARWRGRRWLDLLTVDEMSRWENSDLTAEAIYNQRPKTQSQSQSQSQSQPSTKQDGRVEG